ncbi:MAG TPA: polysaccharide deacetylase family protein [Plasticicumulans sp.]|nr:polysaccharide deacetylase family protein [Plasticicumulans sp.]
MSPVTLLRDAPLRTLLGACLPGGGRARLSILIYHRVLAAPDPLQPDIPDAALFRRHMHLLARQFRPLPLLEAVRRLREGSLPARAVCVTFDDGYADNAAIALPLLQQSGVPATFFVSTGFLEGGRMFNDTVFEVVRRLPEGTLSPDEVPGLDAPLAIGAGAASRIAAAHALIGAVKYLEPAARQAVVGRLAARVRDLPDDLMMTHAQLRALHAAGMEIGGHTVSHPILTRTPAAVARAEIAGGRAGLEALIDAPVRSFAYPNGKPGADYGPEHVAMVRELGFDCAVVTSHGVSVAATDPYQLARFTPWDRSESRFQLRMLRNSRRLHLAA